MRSHYLLEVLVRAVILVAVIPIHECAHGLVASWMGDPTARNMGRLTLNPFAHLDRFGSLMMLLTGLGWAKPVPVNARNFKNPKAGMAITALAGPAANILLALLALAVYKVLYPRFDLAYSFAFQFFFVVIIQNTIYLAVFNMIPIPPLDGSRLVTAILPDRLYYPLMRYERFIMAALMLALFTGLLSFPIRRAAGAILVLLDRMTFFLG